MHYNFYYIWRGDFLSRTGRQVREVGRTGQMYRKGEGEEEGTHTYISSELFPSAETKWFRLGSAIWEKETILLSVSSSAVTFHHRDCTLSTACRSRHSHQFQKRSLAYNWHFHRAKLFFFFPVYIFWSHIVSQLLFCFLMLSIRAHSRNLPLSFQVRVPEDGV